MLVRRFVMRNGTFGDATCRRWDTHTVHVRVENDHSNAELRRFHEEGKHRSHLQTLLDAQAATPYSGHRTGTGNDEKKTIAR